MATRIHSLQPQVEVADYTKATHVADSSTIEGFIELLDDSGTVVALISRHSVYRIDINN